MRSLLVAGALAGALTVSACGSNSSDTAGSTTTRHHRAGPMFHASKSGRCVNSFANWTPMLSGGGISVLTDTAGYQTAAVGLVDGRLLSKPASPGSGQLPYSIEMPNVPASKVQAVTLNGDDGSHCTVPKG